MTVQLLTRQAAAAARATGLRAPADRPQARRCAAERSAPALVVARARIDIREADTDGAGLAFVGYASVTGVGYDMWDWYGVYTESVDPGAFAGTLSRADLDVPFVLQHEDLRRIARTTTGTLALAEDDQGLRVEATLDPADVDVAYIVPKLRAGLIDEMSFKFRIDSGSWSPDWDEYHIHAADLHRGDVAIVGYGANPATAGSGLRAAETAPVRRVQIFDTDTKLRVARPE